MRRVTFFKIHILSLCHGLDKFEPGHRNAHRQHRMSTCNFFSKNNINVLDRPSLYPDMSPIEHVWDDLTKHIYARDQQPQNLAELWQALTEEWNDMT